MTTWKERAPEVQELLSKGATNADIAIYFHVSKKTVDNRLPEMERRGWIKRPQTRKPPQEQRSVPLKTSQSSPKHDEVQIFSNGTHKSVKLLEMSEEQSKDPDHLLRAHGYDKDSWELTSAQNKIWNVYSVADGVQTLYSSSITVKPIVHGWTFEDLLETIKTVQPVHVIPFVDVYRERMLEVPLYDMHWGISGLEQYRHTQMKIYHMLTSRHWLETLFIVGQDLFHVDNFKNTTVNGTQIEPVNVPQAWQDCASFYEPLLQAALEHSETVHVIYSSGNHDSSVSWSFVQYLKARFPQCQFDDRVKERKVHVFGSNFIGITHGDKARKDLIRIFPAEFPLEWSKTTTRECHIGHLHREDEIRGKDEFGLTIRTLATRNKIDQYHDDNGYVTAHRRFMVFEYSEDALESIHYV